MGVRVLDVGQLAVLREVARAGSFAGAARELRCTPQAVAQRVARLEAASGVRLTVRGRSGVVLTEAGRALVRRASRVLGELERAERELSEAAALGPTVQVGSVRSGWYTTELATEFARLTGIRLEPAQVDTSDGLRRVLAGRLDAVLGADLDLVPVPRPTQLHRVDLLHEPVWLACSRQHPAATADEVDLRDLRHAAWLAQPPGAPLRDYLTAACRAAGFEPRIVHTADSWDLIEPLDRNVGVTLCSAIVVPTDRLATRPLAQRLRRTLFAAWRPHHPDADALAALPALARRLYLDYVRRTPLYEAWLLDHPDALPALLPD